MDVFTAIQERRSIRKFLPTAIEKYKLLKILEAARLAPSAKNMQEWRFIVVEDAGIRAQLAKAANGQLFAADAPVIIVACGTAPEYIMPCGLPAFTLDVSIACTHMILEAWELGIGSCWLGAFNEAEVKKLLAIPTGVRVVAIIPFGYPAHKVAALPRKRLENIVSYDKY
jgi:nitroreductase